ncbi:hypothetical protein HDV63DRAFT_370508 [Trichoderma sp. SZMC 28014]
MGRFDAPDPGYQNTKNTQWYHAAPRDIRSPDQLWKEYWQRFNTFSIPLLDEEGYFKIATTIAKDSRSKEDFERRFEKHNERQLGKFHSMLGYMFWYLLLEKTLPPRASVPGETSDPKNLRCLEDIARLLFGYFLDRKDDIKNPKIVVEKQDYTEEDSLPEGAPASVEDETETLIREMDRSPSVDSDYEEFLRTGVIREEWASQPPHDIDLGYRLDEEYKARQESEKIIVEKQDHTEENTCQERGHKHIEDETAELITETSPTSSTDREYEECQEYPYGQDENKWSSQLPGDGDVDWGYKLDAKYKARRMRHKESDIFARTEFESPMLLPDDAASHALNSDDDTPSIQQVSSLISNDSQDLEERDESLATQDAQRRRSSISSKSNSTNSAKKKPDEDEEDNGYKRQKIETLPRPPSPVPVAGSTEDDLANHLALGSSENVVEEQAPEGNNGGRKRRKQKPTTPSSRAKSSRNTLNTRSSRRAKSSTLWELDSSGKPRST